MNHPATTASPTRRALKVWDLPKLLQPVHRHRKTAKKPARERPHFKAILAFVHRNRFAVASQIQRRFPHQLPSDRTARRHLAEMESLGYLDVVETSGTSPLWPKVYFVTRRGLAIIRKSLKATGRDWTESAVDRRRSCGSSSEHILHELFTTEFLLMAWQTAQLRADLEIMTVQRRSLAKHTAFKIILAGRQTRLWPDGMFLYRQEGKGLMCCFVEMDLGSMSIRQMTTKLQRYQAWAETPHAQTYLKDLYQHHGAQQPAAIFRILLVIGSRNRAAQDRRLRHLAAVASESPAMLHDKIWLATVDLIRTATQPDILSQPLWLRLMARADRGVRVCNSSTPLIAVFGQQNASEECLPDLS